MCARAIPKSHSILDSHATPTLTPDSKNKAQGWSKAITTHYLVTKRLLSIRWLIFRPHLTPHPVQSILRPTPHLPVSEKSYHCISPSTERGRRSWEHTQRQGGPLGPTKLSLGRGSPDSPGPCLSGSWWPLQGPRNASPKERTRPESTKLLEEDSAERASILAWTDTLPKTSSDKGAPGLLRAKAKSQGRLPEASTITITVHNQGVQPTAPKQQLSEKLLQLSPGEELWAQEAKVIVQGHRKIKCWSENHIQKSARRANSFFTDLLCWVLAASCEIFHCSTWTL